jgi:signal transduction histidine kinase
MTLRRADDVPAAVARMTSVIDKLIDAARLMDGKAELYFHPGEFDLAALLHDVCKSHRTDALVRRPDLSGRAPATWLRRKRSADRPPQHQ